MISITTRIIKGTEAEILAIIRKNGRSKTINTSFVESRNGKYRKDDAQLNRKTMCHSKKTKYHNAHADFLTTEVILPMSPKLIPLIWGIVWFMFAGHSVALSRGYKNKVLERLRYL